MTYWLTYGALGAFVGFIAGLLGIGGGGVIVPVLVIVFGMQAVPHEHVMHIALATAMADGLAAAHRQQVTHRDLKPDNIMIDAEGRPKILDFGLAKLGALVSTPSPDAPTELRDATTTQHGSLLGTAAYMSPEQARGKPVDKRADIWAFGAVLFEMLTEQRAFGGDDVSEVLSRVLQREPEWAALPSGLSPTLAVYLKRCLQKDLRQRIGDIHDVRLALEGAFETAGPQAVAPTAMAQSAGWRRVATLAVGMLAVAAVGGAVGWFATRPPAPRVMRTTITLPAAAALTISGNDRDLAITPDGSRIVYVGANGTELFVRALDALEPVAVFKGTPRGLFVSPDGQWVAFVAANHIIRKVRLSGGAPTTIASTLWRCWKRSRRPPTRSARCAPSQRPDRRSARA